MRQRVGAITGACAAFAAMAAAGASSASFPGANGMVGYVYDPPPAGGPTAIAEIGPDGQGFAQLTAPEPGINDYDPSYSADGEQIAFIRVPQPANSGQVWTMNADGSGQTQLTAGTDTARDFGPAFSPDGEWIAFDRYDGTVTTQVWVMRADGSDQTQLTFATQSSRSPSFSPDGSKLVFSRSGSGGSGIWTMNADGSGTPQQLTPGSSTADDSDPSYSPDGQRIVFARYGTGGNSDIVVMNADGSGQQPFMPATPFDVSPAFSPDGTKVAFLRGGDELFLADPDGANQAAVPGGVDGYGQSSTTWQSLNPPSCEMTGAPKQKSVKRVDVTLTCSNENVSAVVEGSGSAPKVRGAAASKRKQFTIPPVTQQVPPGTPTTVTLTIPKKGKKALKKATKAGKKGKATIAATLTDDLGQSATDSFEVKFKAKRK